MEILDLKCAQLAEKLAGTGGKDVENALAQALDVLEEQGVYAFFLFLSDPGSQHGKATSRECLQFLQRTPQENPLLKPQGDGFKALQSLAANLDDLLLARDLLRQALVYARYHARARTGESEK